MKRCLVTICLLMLWDSVSAQELTIPEEYCRAADQTYLTFPEWYLVHSPAEYAEFLKHKPPHLFTYWGHINQFWSSYKNVTDAIAEGTPTNYGYRVMIGVIGTSTTVEYGIKSHYEKTIGRLTALTLSDEITFEDQLAQEVAQDYVDFIRVDPWYKYDFWNRTKQVWTGTGFWGKHPLRKWERKYALTTEYLSKAIYAWAIGKATAAGYEAPRHVTAVVVSGGREQDFAGTEFEIIDNSINMSDGRQPQRMVLLPRYQAFTDAARHLSSRGISFQEIACNRDEILVSVLTSMDIGDSESYRVLLRQPILTQPSKARYLLVVPISDLSASLQYLEQEQVLIEHIYDF